jgi:hypothetical protein
MQSKTYTSQKDPPEGSREVVDRELKRQAQAGGHHGGEHKEPRRAEGPPHEAKEDRAKSVR